MEEKKHKEKEKRTLNNISYNEILDFHKFLHSVVANGICRWERNWFHRLKSYESFWNSDDNKGSN